MRPLARQGACGLDPSIRTLSKDAPGDQGESQGTTGGFEVPGVSNGTGIKRALAGMVAGSPQRDREEKPLTQILLEQPGEHRVPVRDKIRLPLL